MAKYIKSYENGIEKHELVFKGNVFAFSMIPSEYGAESDKKTFEEQIHEKHPDISVELLEEIGSGDLWCEDDENEIFEILNRLEDLEG